MALTPEFRKKFEFDWQVLDVVVSGRSAIDAAATSGLQLRGPDEIARFLECYGYDLENPIEKAELFGNFQEAVSFMRRYFLKPDNNEGLEIEIPRKITEMTDITQLMTFASQPVAPGTPPAQNLSHWACAVIKLMHTIAHMDRDLLGSYYFSDVQKQILDRFYKHVHSDADGKLYLGKDSRDAERIDLVTFESKPRKSRDSVILKLLHKPENVAEDIFDRVGIRFVTKNKFDSLRVVKYLKERYVIMPANIKPSRSRNNLVDIDAFRVALEDILRAATAGTMPAGEVYDRLVAACEGDSIRGDARANPHTSSEYRSLQFTGRHLIKLKNPVYDDLKALKAAVKGATVADGVAKIVEGIELKNIQKETRFFYPFEVQVYDEIAHKDNLAGQSSHTNYKKSQVRAAMKRVMGPLM